MPEIIEYMLDLTEFDPTIKMELQRTMNHFYKIHGNNTKNINLFLVKIWYSVCRHEYRNGNGSIPRHLRDEFINALSEKIICENQSRTK